MRRWLITSIKGWIPVPNQTNFYFFGIKFEIRQSLLVQSSQDGKNMWIGMKDFGSNGYFLWTDDTAVQFTNWNPGEPNHRMGDDQEIFITRDPSDQPKVIMKFHKKIHNDANFQ